MKPNNSLENLDSFRQEIEEVIEQDVRPILRAHGGDVYIKSVDEGNVRVVFTGMCKTCPSAQLTIEDVVAKTLEAKLGNRIKSVSLVNEVDEEMLSFAKELLNKKK